MLTFFKKIYGSFAQKRAVDLYEMLNFKKMLKKVEYLNLM